MRILVILLVALTVAACSGLMIGGGSAASPAVEKDRPAATRTGDAALADKVATRLAADPALGALGIGVSASGGLVTLSGTVPSYAAREAAEKLAMTTAGVNAVDNRITVKYSK